MCSWHNSASGGGLGYRSGDMFIYYIYISHSSFCKHGPPGVQAAGVPVRPLPVEANEKGGAHVVHRDDKARDDDAHRKQVPANGGRKLHRWGALQYRHDSQHLERKKRNTVHFDFITGRHPMVPLQELQMSTREVAGHRAPPAPEAAALRGQAAPRVESSNASAWW